jgi:hypothetical protein
VQARVLAVQGWQFTLDGDGKPLVLRRAHDERLGMKGPPRRRRPRLDALAA